MGQGFQGDGVLGYYYLKLIGLGVCIGILSAVLRTIFHIDDAVFWHWYWTVGVIFVLGAALVYILYVQRYAKRMREAIACYEKGEIQTYMDKLEAMLNTAKGRNLRNTLKIDLSVGHYAKKEYESAIRILEDTHAQRSAAGLSAEPLPVLFPHKPERSGDGNLPHGQERFCALPQKQLLRREYRFAGYAGGDA